MKRIDEARLDIDLTYRLDYLRGFIGFTDEDIEAILSARPVLSPFLPDLVNLVYDKLFEFDATKHQYGYEGPVPDSIEDLGVNHEMIRFRKEHLAEYLTKLMNGPYDTTLFTYLNSTGRMHTPGVGREDLIIPLIQMNAMLGFLADAISNTIFGLAITEDAKANMVRAFNKLLWIQNDLISRHYTETPVLADADKSISVVGSPSTPPAPTHTVAIPTQHGIAGANPGG